MCENRDLSGYDPVLLPYLKARDPEAGDRRELKRLVTIAGQVLQRVLGSHFNRESRGATQMHRRKVSDQMDEVRAIVNARLVPLLVRHRIDRSLKPISNFRSYVGAIAMNACKDIASDSQSIVPLSEDLARSESATRQLEMRDYLERMWNEIAYLNTDQRQALLLNLREITLFPLLGLATIREIAELVDIPSVEFADVWNMLPLPDDWIGQRLGCSRQRVINLRSSARKRLLRRLGER